MSWLFNLMESAKRALEDHKFHQEQQCVPPTAHMNDVPICPMCNVNLQSFNEKKGIYIGSCEECVPF